MNPGMYSSATGEWSTPQDLFDKLNARFHFETDVCASAENAKCPHYYDKQQDSFKQEWRGSCWMNPPYGREIAKWVQKAVYSADQGATVVCLLPARTDTRWWQVYVQETRTSPTGPYYTVQHADRIWFLPGRLKFSGQRNSAPFPSAVVVYGIYNMAGPGGSG